MKETTMRRTAMEAEVAALLRSRHPVLWIVTQEEARVERSLLRVAKKLGGQGIGMDALSWDCARGLSSLDDSDVLDPNPDPAAMLDRLTRMTSPLIVVARDFGDWLQDPMTRRRVRNTAAELAKSDKVLALVILSTSGDVPPDLEPHVTVIEWPLPDRAEIDELLANVLQVLPESVRAKANGDRSAAVDAATGLTEEKASNAFALSLVQCRRVDPVRVAADKRRAIQQQAGLEWSEPHPRGLDAVGGLDLWKRWLALRQQGLSDEAREYGLPAPKGVLLIGVPGCGKSLSAKAVAAAWKLPLLRLDLGAQKSKFVGESEGNIRRALQVAETMSPCVLWLDELEKALAGSTGPQGDGGVAADALGTVLNWLQERTGSVFVIATANDVKALPPELLRKGRWDEIFFVDLPNRGERVEVLRAALVEHGRENVGIDLERVADATEGFAGSEIAAIVPDALFVGFSDNRREITTDDLVCAARDVTPLSKTMAEKIKALRTWADGRARRASTLVLDPIPDLDAIMPWGADS